MLDQILGKNTTIILGGGLAGLSAGYVLTKAELGVKVFESDSTVGGLSKTIIHDGFRFDLGGHRFFTKDRELNNFVKELMREEIISVQRKSKIYMRNKYFDYPLKPFNAILGLGVSTTMEILADYAAEKILGMTQEELFSNLDECNKKVYQDPERRCYLGLIALHNRDGKRFFTLETVEVDTMGADMLKYFYDFTKNWLDPTIPLVIKPANHQQEAYLSEFDPIKYPRVYNHELFASENFISLNNGIARGRLRAFADKDAYKKAFATIEWYDIVCMPQVPDNIPRVAAVMTDGSLKNINGVQSKAGDKMQKLKMMEVKIRANFFKNVPFSNCSTIF